MGIIHSEASNGAVCCVMRLEVKGVFSLLVSSDSPAEWREDDKRTANWTASEPASVVPQRSN